MHKEEESKNIHGEGTCAMKFSGATAAKIISFPEMEVSSGLSGYICVSKWPGKQPNFHYQIMQINKSSSPQKNS